MNSPAQDVSDGPIRHKFNVTRTDGSSEPGGKHEDCEYFVLDMTHDKFAIAAMEAYAFACEATYPNLAADIRSQWVGHPTLARELQRADDSEIAALFKTSDGTAIHCVGGVMVNDTYRGGVLAMRISVGVQQVQQVQEVGDLGSLKDSNTVHAMMLRGQIAIPSWRNMVDLRGEVPNGEDVQLSRIAELQEQLADLRGKCEALSTDISEAVEDVARSGGYINSDEAKGWSVELRTLAAADGG